MTDRLLAYVHTFLVISPLTTRFLNCFLNSIYSEHDYTIASILALLLKSSQFIFMSFHNIQYIIFHIKQVTLKTNEL